MKTIIIGLEYAYFIVIFHCSYSQLLDEPVHWNYFNDKQTSQNSDQHHKWSFYHSAAERFTKFKWIFGNIFIDLPNVATAMS